MQIVATKAQLRTILAAQKRKEKRIGFVPTMGYLHEGHLSLMRCARAENDIVVVSVFVNPTQFAPNEDLEAYPRDASRDRALMEAEDVDIAFFPSVEEIYPTGHTTVVEVKGPMTQCLCGQTRPTHFRGVTTVVAKLFHMVTPDRAYFGQKDAQQAAVIRRMAADLDFDLEIVVCPIVREPDGLAMSSRNTYLTPGQRISATALRKALLQARAMAENGERDAKTLIQSISTIINGATEAQIDYVAVVDARTLAPLSELEGEVLIAVAVFFGKTRLLDNIVLSI